MIETAASNYRGFLRKRAKGIIIERARETGRRLFLSVGRNADKDPSIPRGPEDWDTLTTIYNDYPFNGVSRSLGRAVPYTSLPVLIGYVNRA